MVDANEAIHPPEVQEVIGYVPHWILRAGTVVLLAFVVFALIGAWAIRSPDVIRGRMTLTTERPPARIVARSTGRIEHLFAQAQQSVAKGSLIAAIENPASLDEVSRLRDRLLPLRDPRAAEVELNDIDARRLGALQEPFSSYRTAHEVYNAFQAGHHLPKKIESINAQIAQLQGMDAELVNKKGLIEEDVQLGRRKYEMNRGLLDQNLVPEAVVLGFEEEVLAKLSELKEIDIRIAANRIELTELERTRLETVQELDERRKSLEFSVDSAYEKLLSDLVEWEQRYLLRAPTDGTVAFYKFWSEGQFVNEGEEVFMVIPELSQFVGKIELPQLKSGKIKVGQRVILKYDNYPPSEFGVADGVVKSVSQISREGKYLVNVAIPNGLRTSYGKTLEFTPEMQASADIVTVDRRLIDRVFYQLRYAFSSATAH
jgi:HlyD family secretion protein